MEDTSGICCEAGAAVQFLWMQQRLEGAGGWKAFEGLGRLSVEGLG